MADLTYETMHPVPQRVRSHVLGELNRLAAERNWWFEAIDVSGADIPPDPVLAADAYYQCFAHRPRHARKPDVSFIRRERLPEDWLADGYFTIAPDLAVEVVSPNDLFYEVDEKIREYRDAGVQLIWVINPEQRWVTVYRADGSVAWLQETDTIEGETIIPGFSCPVGELFPPRPA